jgi:arginine utilization regulatory protein
MNTDTMHAISNFDLSDVDVVSFLSDLDDGVIISDTTGTIVFYNRQQAKMDGLDPRSVIGRKATDIYDLDADASKIMRCLDTGKAIRGHLFFYQTAMGRVVNTIHSVFPLVKDGKQIGVICIVKDYNILDKTIASSSRGISQERRELSNGTRFTFADMISVDSTFMNCMKTARMAANSPSSVMIYGETGTGKEMFAQSIHNYSSRRERNFMAVNCAAIPENLLEGILFGTSKGAFTNALDRPGLMEQANGGTLFLDEVNSMPVGLQSKLLRVLQEKKVRRVGSLNEVWINLKIISAVNREPRQTIADGILRQDLFYRLGVVFIHIPPLFERPDDIDFLTRHFIDKLNFILEKKVQHLSSKVETLFKAYHWPGNVRELEHVIEGAMNMVGDEKTIHIRHLPPYFVYALDLPKADTKSDESAKPANTYDEPTFGGDGSQQLDAPENTETLVSRAEKIAKEEKTLIAQTLSEFRGHVSRSAKALGISRQLLNYKMKKYGMKRRDYI